MRRDEENLPFRGCFALLMPSRTYHCSYTWQTPLFLPPILLQLQLPPLFPSYLGIFLLIMAHSKSHKFSFYLKVLSICPVAKTMFFILFRMLPFSVWSQTVSNLPFKFKNSNLCNKLHIEWVNIDIQLIFFPSGWR